MNLRNTIFLSSLLTIFLASCAPSLATDPVETVSTSPKLNPPATLTPAPSKTPSPTATLEPDVMNSIISPNGEYTAFPYDYRRGFEQAVEIKDKTGKLIWRIPYQGELPHGDPHPIMEVHRWSDDSSQLYFCYSWGSDGGDPPIQSLCYNLQQVDIKTGKVQSVVISPDESHIGYITCQEESCIVHVQNISTGLDKTASIVFEKNEYLTPLWGVDWYNDPDFVFELQNENHIIQMFYLDVSTMKYRVIKKYPAPPLPGWAEFQWWVDSNTLMFLEPWGEDVQVVYVDVRSSETLVIGTPTPTPDY